MPRFVHDGDLVGHTIRLAGGATLSYDTSSATGLRSGLGPYYLYIIDTAWQRFWQGVCGFKLAFSGVGVFNLKSFTTLCLTIRRRSRRRSSTR